MAQAGVGGATSTLSPSAPAPSPEVKYKDYNLVASPGTGGWSIISSDSIYSIAQGTGYDQRVGRKIKVVGLVIRSAVSTSNVTTTPPGPYTMDVLWDNQMNGTIPAITDIYVGGTSINLPNPLVDSRFQFIRRIGYNNPQSQHSLVNATISCNKLIEYKASTNLPADLTASNLLITFCSPYTSSPQLSGVVRVLYVDA